MLELTVHISLVLVNGGGVWVGFRVVILLTEPFQMNYFYFGFLAISSKSSQIRSLSCSKEKKEEEKISEKFIRNISEIQKIFKIFRTAAACLEEVSSK